MCEWLGGNNSPRGKFVVVGTELNQHNSVVGRRSASIPEFRILPAGFPSATGPLAQPMIGWSSGKIGLAWPCASIGLVGTAEKQEANSLSRPDFYALRIYSLDDLHSREPTAPAPSSKGPTLPEDILNT